MIGEMSTRSIDRYLSYSILELTPTRFETYLILPFRVRTLVFWPLFLVLLLLLWAFTALEVLERNSLRDDGGGHFL